MPWKADDIIDGIYLKYFKFADDLERCRAAENEVEADNNLLGTNLSMQNVQMVTWLAGSLLIKKILIDDKWGREATSFKMGKGVALKVKVRNKGLGTDIMHAQQ